MIMIMIMIIMITRNRFGKWGSDSQKPINFLYYYQSILMKIYFFCYCLVNKKIYYPGLISVILIDCQV